LFLGTFISPPLHFISKTKATAMDDLTKKHHNMFVAAACFNFIAALSLLKPSLLFDTLGIKPVPNEDLTLHITCLLIAFYGVMYYRASKDFVKNANAVEVGCIAKATVFCVTLLDIKLGYITWQILPVVSGDLIFAILFYKALADLYAAKKK